MVGANGMILYGGGNSWQIYEPSPTTQNLYSVCGDWYYFEPNTTWAVGAGGTILHYQDGAWNLYPSSPTTEDLFCVYVRLYNLHFHAWACGANGTILRWDGASWTKINNVPTNENLYSICGYEEDVWSEEFCVGANGTILFSDDGGLNWHFENCPVNVDLHGVEMDNEVTWAVGDEGTILSHGEVPEIIQPQSLGRVKALYYGCASVSQKQPMSKKLPVNR